MRESSAASLTIEPGRVLRQFSLAARIGPHAAQDHRGGPGMYQVYALKYGERDTTACQFFYREPSHDPLPPHFYVWLILGGPHPVLVDAGCREEDATARGLRN